MGLICEKILTAIRHEMNEADTKHGLLTTDPVRASAIMVREGAEVMNEALLMTRPGAIVTRASRKRMFIEAAQVAATCILIMENLDREGV